MKLDAERCKKALECCSKWICDECPNKDESPCTQTTSQDALTLITSQEQRIKELTEEVESLKQCMEHEHASFMETFGEYGEKCDRLTEENERILTALANYDRQTEVRIFENYYTVEAYEELREENEKLRVVLKMNDAPFPEGLQIVHDFCEKGKRIAKADTVQEYREGLHKEFASLGAKDKFNKEFFLTKADQIAKEMESANG